MIEGLKSIDELKAEFEALENEENEIDALLQEVHSTKPDLEVKAVQLQRLDLDSLEEDATHLTKMIDHTSSLADQISKKVRQLDLAKTRVFEAIQRVDDILDLKFCSDGVEKAMAIHDLESAAGHIHRYLCLDENLLKESVSDERESIQTSIEVLEAARKKLSELVDKEFAEAAKDGDENKVEKYLRLFPLLKEPEKGLDKFGKFLQIKITKKSKEAIERARNKEISFADAATVVFESIAGLVDKSQPFVETYYGPGQLKSMVFQLQKECDKQAINVLQAFDMDRGFSALSQKVMKSKRGDVDSLSLDAVLTETARLSERGEMYFRFLRRRLATDLESVSKGEKLDEEVRKLENWIGNTSLAHHLQSIMGKYVSMEKYYMKESLQKAIQMDQFAEGSLTSSMIDDTFYILKKSRDRAVMSGNFNCVCAVINHISSLLESDFFDTLSSNLRSFPSGGLMDNLSMGITAFSGTLTGAMGGSGKVVSAGDAAEEQRQLFLTSLSNAEIAVGYIGELASVEIVRRLGRKLSAGETENMNSCVEDLKDLAKKFEQLVENGIKELNNSALKHEVKPLIEDFRDVPHDIDDDEFAEAEANEPWVQNVLIHLHTVLESFKPRMSPDSFDQLVSYLTNTVANTLERAVLKSRFTRLGGLQFDRELRALVNFLTSVTSSTVRDRFAKLHQINTVLNLEQPQEVLEYYGSSSSGVTWRLSPSEVRDVLTRRIDFRSEDIRRLKL
ncbi:Oidioi.mRNA.OKI2018_I69.PAR.g9273.t1.cds [Oikopleura dioica]|uniref:Conserved oligomeric Golgi complex subunit 4 n=1 Tax=Oikopleura dioica TaxID=34765 RepID=A0ABN7RNG4_OIKDI|nr:Oidioi.mRNA.OKI2018_I69.PAR.g9273.t1.cds [Oikopleura dioica]